MRRHQEKRSAVADVDAADAGRHAEDGADDQPGLERRRRASRSACSTPMHEEGDDDQQGACLGRRKRAALGRLHRRGSIAERAARGSGLCDSASRLIAAQTRDFVADRATRSVRGSGDLALLGARVLLAAADERVRELDDLEQVDDVDRGADREQRRRPRRSRRSTQSQSPCAVRVDEAASRARRARASAHQP